MEKYGSILTVREALEMPIFTPARIVAGHSGLNSQIRWVHIIDIPNADYEWGRRGVLLLTAGFGLQGDAKRQAELVPKLAEQGFAGMVLSIGQYFQHTPSVIREAADELGFPVIEMPYQVLFVDITEAIFERIVNRQYAVLQQANRIHAKLTELVLQGCNLDHLVSTLADILRRSVTIEDASLRVLAAAQHGSVDEARRWSVSHGRTTPEVAQRLLDSGIYDQLLHKMAPRYVSPMPDLGMTMERIVAPIIVDQKVYGYIWVIAGDHPLNDLDELAIEHGATVAALILLKEQAVRNAKEALRGDFFRQLLRGAGDSAALTEQARQLNYRLSQPHQVLLIHITSEANGYAQPLVDAVEGWFRDRRTGALMVWREDGLVLVIESDNATLGDQLATSIVEDLSHPASRLLIGVGSTCDPGNNKAISIGRSYEEAREAVRVGVAIGQREGVIPFDSLGLLHWLYHLSPEQRSGNVYLQHIRTLASYDARHNKELVKTLEAYLDYGGSLAEAAKALYVHRNTLLHRIDRIENLCAVDLRDPIQRLNLHVAIKCYQLHEA